MQELKPVLDLEYLQKKANEYAQKGAEDSIKEFYNGYNSPYKKAIEESLKNKGVDTNFDIPDIVAVLNQKLSTEIDAIANTAIAKTFIPLVKDFLIREDSEVKFSDILKKFIEVTDYKYGNLGIHRYQVNKIEKEERSQSLNDSFPVYQITNGEDGFELRFYADKKVTSLMSLPSQLKGNKKYMPHYEQRDTMKLSLDGGATLEMPFVRGVLENDFVRYCARLVIGNCNIIFDVQEFEEDMFPEDECHCNH